MSSLVAPLFEEVAFRGAIFRAFRAHYSATKAVLISTALFAVAHSFPFQWFTAFVIGLLCGFSRVVTGSLVVAVVVHATNNTFVNFGFIQLGVDSFDWTPRAFCMLLMGAALLLPSSDPSEQGASGRSSRLVDVTVALTFGLTWCWDVLGTLVCRVDFRRRPVDRFLDRQCVGDAVAAPSFGGCRASARRAV
ncbi:MAG: CPBP family intramembrane metalloprotease, partial [Rhodospirillales bacterium]|nr:CPBP family intramembrane metalloprotease [Rhodospirillales bacterium]